MVTSRKINKILASFKKKDILADSIFTQNLDIIRHNLQIIESAKVQARKDSKDQKVSYGFHKVNQYIVAHPGIKMIEAAEKAMMSCFRQMDIKPEALKEFKESPLMLLQKSMSK